VQESYLPNWDHHARANCRVGVVGIELKFKSIRAHAFKALQPPFLPIGTNGTNHRPPGPELWIKPRSSSQLQQKAQS